MTDLLLQIALSNVCLSLALAIVAAVVGAKAKRARLAHLLWVMVFVKLMTPPVLTIPLITISGQSEATLAINNGSRPGLPVAGGHEFGVDAKPTATLSAKIGAAVLKHGREWLPPIWLLGSLVVFGWSLIRVCRFGRLLAAESEAARQELQAAAVKIARRLKLNAVPAICTTSARLSPMVWWTGGKVRIVIPAALIADMDEKQWQWIVAHELAHVRRRDYLVRWLEWMACVCFWWNPVAWWAQRNLRAMEEICCDDLVMSCLKPKPHSYANSILAAVEYLACPAYRPPAMASEINSGGYLERRCRLIVSNRADRSHTHWLHACGLLGTVLVLPLGVACVHDSEAVGQRLRAAVPLTEAEESSAEKGAAPDSKANLIVPGEGVGQFTIGATKAELIDKLGQPREAFLGGETFALNHLPDTYYLLFGDLSFLIEAGRVKGVTALSPRWKLANGVAVGASEKEVRRAMGPEYVLEESRARDFLLYPKAGLSFEIDKTNRTVMEINVYPKRQL